jgi:hypothetical protein
VWLICRGDHGTSRRWPRERQNVVLGMRPAGGDPDEHQGSRRAGAREVPDGRIDGVVGEHIVSATRLQRLRLVMIDRQRWLCYWCQLPMLPANHPDLRLRATADHIQPRSQGGRTTASNIVAAHGLCNNSRHNCETKENAVSRGTPLDEILRLLLALEPTHHALCTPEVAAAVHRLPQGDGQDRR